MAIQRYEHQRATNTTLTIANAQLTNAGNYMVTVTNLYGATNSVPAVLTVYGLPPSIVTQPTNRTVLVGSTATFTVAAKWYPAAILPMEL